MGLADRRCEPCTAATPRATEAEIAAWSAELHRDWRIEAGHLRRDWKVADFLASLALANRVAPVAEAEGHHPDLTVRWGSFGVELYTHAIGGLSEADFVLAAKLDQAIG